MAKMRVYELARDLNLTNKILLSKLSDMDISVKSHMSSLDDDAVARIKAVIFGKKEDTVEETRIKPTVIRRRRKRVKVEVAPEPAAKTKNTKTAEKVEAQTPEAAAKEEAAEIAEETAAVQELPAEETPTVEDSAKKAEPAAEAEKPVELKGKKPKKPAKKVKNPPILPSFFLCVCFFLF